jgi:hypothetical protein
VVQRDNTNNISRPLSQTSTPDADEVYLDGPRSDDAHPRACVDRPARCVIALPPVFRSISRAGRCSGAWRYLALRLAQLMARLPAPRTAAAGHHGACMSACLHELQLRSAAVKLFARKHAMPGAQQACARQHAVRGLPSLTSAAKTLPSSRGGARAMMHAAITPTQNTVSTCCRGLVSVGAATLLAGRPCPPSVGGVDKVYPNAETRIRGRAAAESHCT